MNKKIIVGVLLVFLVAMYIIPGFEVTSKDSGAMISYHSEVCKYLKRAGETEWESIGCSPNTLTTAGANSIKDYLGQAGAAAYNAIAVANNTPAGNLAVGDTDLDNRTTCCGLTIATGSYAAVGGQNGNWTISKVFTATSIISEVNATGIFNATAPGTLLAYNAFVPVNLQTNDQLNVTWNIWVV